MKQEKHSTLFIAGLLISTLLLLHCGNSREISKEQVAEELLGFLNKQLPGSNLIVSPENRTVESLGKNRYRVTFKNFTFKTDVSGIVSLISKLMIKTDDFPRLDTFRVEESVMIYDAGTKDIPEYWLKNMGIDYELPLLPGNKLKARYGKEPLKKLCINIGKIYHRKTDHKISSSTGAVSPYDSTIENVKLGLTFETKQKDLLTGWLEIEKMEDPQTGQEDPDVFMYLWDKDAPEPDLNNTLKKGLAIADVSFQVGRVKVSIEKNGVPLAAGSAEKVSYSLFMKPDNSSTGFKWGYVLGIKDLALSMPGKEEVHLLSNVKDFRFDFCIEPINPQAALISLKLFKTICQMRPIPDKTSSQTLMFLALQFLSEAMKSSPVARYSIDPFSHYFGDIKATADIRLQGQFPMIKPNATIKVDIFKVDDILKKLREANVFSPAILNTISKTLGEYTVKKDNGDATTIIEVKADYPGMYFLNGEARKVHKPSTPQKKLF